MPRIEADFSNIAAIDNSPLPDNDYRLRIKTIESKITQENQLPAVNFTMEVDDPNFPQFEGKHVYDMITLKTKQGEPNKMGLGQLKAYAIATLGEEAANSTDGIDTDAMIGSHVLASVALRSWEKNGKSGMNNEVRKVSAA